MISDWSVNLLDLVAEHRSGVKVKVVPNTYGEVEKFQIIDGRCNNETAAEGLACIKHASAKNILHTYLDRCRLTLSEIVNITNKYIKEKEYDYCISESKLKEYMTDKKIFPSGEIGTIRSAIYFYKKKNLSHSNPD